MKTLKIVMVFLFFFSLFLNSLYAQGFIHYGKPGAGYMFGKAKFKDISMTSHMVNLSPNGKIDFALGVSKNNINFPEVFNAGLNVYAIKPENKLPFFPSVSLAYSSSKYIRGIGFGASVYGNIQKNKNFKFYPEIGISFTQVMAKDGNVIIGDSKSKEIHFTLNSAIKMGSIAHLLIAPGMSWNKDGSTAFISIGILFSEQ